MSCVAYPVNIYELASAGAKKKKPQKRDGFEHVAACALLACSFLSCLLCLLIWLPMHESSTSGDEVTPDRLPLTDTGSNGVGLFN